MSKANTLLWISEMPAAPLSATHYSSGEVIRYKLPIHTLYAALILLTSIPGCVQPTPRDAGSDGESEIGSNPRRASSISDRHDALERGHRFVGPTNHPYPSWGKSGASGSLSPGSDYAFSLMRSDTLSIVWLYARDARASEAQAKAIIVAALAFDPRRERGRLLMGRDIGEGCYLQDDPSETMRVIGLAVFDGPEEEKCGIQEAKEVTEAWLMDEEEEAFRRIDPSSVTCYRGGCP